MGEKTALITGSCGLIGSEMVLFFSSRGWRVAGMDNHMRAVFFGREGDTRWMLSRLTESGRNYQHHEIDVRDRDAVAGAVARVRPHFIVHAAAQPSHDKAASIPFLDFEVNALGTLNLLEAARQ